MALTLDYWPHPLTGDGRVTTEIGEGIRLADAVTTVAPLDADVVVSVNTFPIAREHWPTVTLRRGDVCKVRARLAGGKGSNPIVALLSIVTLVVAPYLAASILPAAFSAIGATFAQTAILSGLTAVIGAAGLLITNTIFPTRLPEAQDLGFGDGLGQADPQYTLYGGSNRARPNEPLLLLLGQHRVFPDIVAQEYPEFETDGAALPYVGIYMYAQGIVPSGIVRPVPRARVTGSGDQYLNQIYDFGVGKHQYSNLSLGDTLLLEYDDIETQSGVDKITLVSGNVDTIPGGDLADPQGNSIVRTTPIRTIKVAFDLVSQQFRVNDEGDLVGRSNTFVLEWRRHASSDAWIERAVTISTQSGSKGRNQTRRSFVFDVPSDQYDLRATLSSRWSETDERTTGNATLAAFRAYQIDEADFDGRNPLALRLKATGQHYGRMDEISADVAQLIPDWTGAAWVADQITSSPASIYRKYLQGWYDSRGRLLAGMGLPDRDINDDQIERWHAFCERHGLTCDLVLLSRRDHASVLRVITQCGWASVDQSSGKFGVLWEDEDRPISGLITPANIVAGTMGITYDNENLADEIIGTFVDRESDYEPNQIKRVIEGVEIAQRPVRIPLHGITQADAAAKEVNRAAAAQVHHVRKIGWQMSHEGWLAGFGRGDVIGASHDLIGGTVGGRLLAINAARDGVTLSAAAIEPGLIWVWCLDGAVQALTYEAPDYPAEDVNLSGALPAAPAGVEDDPLSYRFMAFAGSAARRRIRITSVEPAPGGNIQFFARDDVPEYYDARVADLEHKIIRVTRARPSITSIDVFDTLERAVGGFRVVLHVAVLAEGDFRQAVIRADAAIVGEVLAGERLSFESPIPSGPIEIQATPGNRLASFGRTFSVTYDVKGKAWPPQDVANFSVAQISDGTRVYSWDPVPDPDVSLSGGYEIRYEPQGGARQWADMTPIALGVLTETRIERIQPSAGDWTFAIRARDSSGIYSVNPTFSDASLGAARIGDAALEACPSLDGWPGDVENAVRDGPRLTAAGGYRWSDLLRWSSWLSWEGGQDIDWTLYPIRYTSTLLDLGAPTRIVIRSTYNATGNVSLEYRTADSGAFLPSRVPSGSPGRQSIRRGPTPPGPGGEAPRRRSRGRRPSGAARTRSA